MVGTKKYLASMNYYTKNDEKGEGSSLIDGNEHNVTKSQCKECMMCICHNKNTCNKDTFIGDRKSVVQGKSVDIGGCRSIKKKKKKGKKKKTSGCTAGATVKVDHCAWYEEV